MEATRHEMERRLRVRDAYCRLARGEIHLWLASLILPPEALTACHRFLSFEELAMAARFRFARDRNDFVAAHGMLRWLLAGYVGRAPHELRFSRNASGKPSLDHEFAGGVLRFNISYSRGAAIFGIALEREIGVDIECESTNAVEGIDMLTECLAPNERAALRSLCPRARARAFFMFWTLKEAFLKAHGDGLSFPLSLLDVSAVPAGHPRILSSGGGFEDGECWTLRTIRVFPGYAAAAAYRGNSCRIIRRRLQEVDIAAPAPPAVERRPSSLVETASCESSPPLSRV
jgi:4'-phosphopantetheinyl transferase